MIAVNFAKQKYYVLEEATTQVYNFRKERLSAEDLKKTGFKTKEEFANFLRMLHLKTQPIQYYDERAFRNLVRDNLMQGAYAISYESTKELIKRVNYKILRLNDVNGTLKTLVKIMQTHKLVFKTIQFPHNKTKKDFSKGILTYLSPPYGNLEKEVLKTIPLCFELVIQEL